MKFILLSDRPKAAPQVAAWYFHQWERGESEATLQDSLAKISRFLDQDTPAFMVLAEEKSKILGAANLNLHEMPSLPDFEFWLGGVYVDHRQRRRGIGSALAQEIMVRAKAMGIQQLYLQTEDLTGGLYCGLGFTPLLEADCRGYRALVMVAQLL